jgi:hypothetical protein
MKTTATILLSTVIVAAASAQTPASTVPASAPPPAFATTRNSPSYQAAVFAMYEHYEVAMAAHCDKVEIVSRQPPVILAPFQLNDKGEILNAQWKEVADANACGEQRRFNALVTIRDGKPQVTPEVPGDSAAGAVLEHDTLQYALAAIPKQSAGCQMDVLNAHVTSAYPVRQEGGLMSPWVEQWTVRSCGKKYLVTLHYTPDATGTTIEASPGETKSLP